MVQSSASRHIPLFLCALLSVSLGYVCGRIVETVAIDTPSIRMVNDGRSKYATVHLTEILNGELYGSTVGDVSVFIGHEQVPLGSGGVFQVAAGPLLYNHIEIVVPDGMHFVASKKGSKYYPVLSASAQRLAPQNRVYFESAAQAESAGYK